MSPKLCDNKAKATAKEPARLMLPTPRAVSISNDMQAFAGEVAQRFCNGEYCFNAISYQRTVRHDRFGDRFVSVMPKPILDSDLRRDCACADPLGAVIRLFLVPNQTLNPLHVASLVEHELVHIFDPKLTQHDLRNKPWGIRECDANGKLDFAFSPNLAEYATYAKLPWEIDAHMAVNSVRSVQATVGQANNSAERPLECLANYQPTSQIEKLWQQDPALWRRYLKTLYATALRFIKSKS